MKQIALLLEDDSRQARTIKNAIEMRFPALTVEIVETEHDVYKEFDQMEAKNQLPRLVISDVMMPWTVPGPNMPKAPKEVFEGSFREAGIRCLKRFRRISNKVPWICFTVLDAESIGFQKNADEYTGYVQKDGPVDPLLEEIENYLRLDDESDETDESLSRKLAQSCDIRQKLITALNTPISECISQ